MTGPLCEVRRSGGPAVLKAFQYSWTTAATDLTQCESSVAEVGARPTDYNTDQRLSACASGFYWSVWRRLLYVWCE